MNDQANWITSVSLAHSPRSFAPTKSYFAIGRCIFTPEIYLSNSFSNISTVKQSSAIKVAVNAAIRFFLWTWYWTSHIHTTCV